MSKSKCSECGKEFTAKTKNEAFDQLKEHRKEEHLKRDKGDFSYTK
ncbi:MAG: hypothetical protein BAJALOKI1v1_640006 [Promethearchaeota archaeon]|nr:MAG: hypothetical protein BAJALOKI1v1_640006 [Candidatus Lokiarchaeota archaeon]